MHIFWENWPLCLPPVVTATTLSSLLFYVTSHRGTIGVFDKNFILSQKQKSLVSFIKSLSGLLLIWVYQIIGIPKTYQSTKKCLTGLVQSIFFVLFWIKYNISFGHSLHIWRASKAFFKIFKFIIEKWLKRDAIFAYVWKNCRKLVH